MAIQVALAVQTPEVRRPVPVAFFAGTFEERVRKAADSGADGLELMAADPRQLDAGRLSHRIRGHGLEVVAVGSGAVPFATGLTLLHREPEQAALARERLHELIAFAAAVGAPLVTIGGFRGRLAASGDGAREELMDALRTGAEDAARHGVRLALEPLNRYEADVVNTAEEGLGLVDEVGHRALGLLLDTFHVNIEEASWTEPFRRLIEAGKLWHVHIGDNNRLPPGRGLIDFRAIVGALVEAGYQGALSGELLVGDDPDQAAYETVTFLDQLLSRGEP